MRIICHLAGHEADRGQAYNGGFHFSRCRRCGRDMIRSSGEWRMVPDGHRVAWKAGRHSHSIEPDYARVLPVLHSQANLPAVRSGFTSWSRQLALLAAGRKEKPAAPPDEKEAKENEPFPKLIVIVALIGAGLQLLFGLGARWREPAQDY
jgi:hypothetical protein